MTNEIRVDPNWTCRDYELGDEDEILELFRIAFGESRSNRFWRWQYLESPAGKGIIKLLFDDGRLIGHYAAVPVEMSVAGRSLSAVQSIDTMVHPSYGRRGIFTYLASKVFEESSARGHRLVYGFPNENSYHGFVNRLGWTGFGTMNAFVAEPKEIRHQSALEDKLGNVAPLENFDDSADLLWETCEERRRVAVARTSRYLNWRFVSKPDVKYSLFGVRDPYGNLDGYAVTKIFSREDGFAGHIVDLLCKNSEDIPVLLEACYSDLLVKASRISCWVDSSSRASSVLQSDGFRMERTETYFGVKPLSNSPELSPSTSRHNWHITMGDSDVF